MIADHSMAALLTTLASLALLWLVAVVTPGPNFIVIFHAAAARTRAHAVATSLGCVAGTAVWAVIGVFGFKALAAALPWAFGMLKLAGALYLLWAGVQMWRSASQPIDFAPAPATRSALYGSFRTGLITTLANPKTAAFAASIFSVAVPAGAPIWFAFAAITTILAVSLTWYAVLAALLAAGWMSAFRERIVRPVRRIAGAAFVGYGVSMALEK